MITEPTIKICITVSDTVASHHGLQATTVLLSVRLKSYLKALNHRKEKTKAHVHHTPVEGYSSQKHVHHLLRSIQGNTRGRQTSNALFQLHGPEQVYYFNAQNSTVISLPAEIVPTRKPNTRGNGNVPKREQSLSSRGKKVTDTTLPEQVTKETGNTYSPHNG